MRNLWRLQRPHPILCWRRASAWSAFARISTVMKPHCALPCSSSCKRYAFFIAIGARCLSLKSSIAYDDAPYCALLSTTHCMGSSIFLMGPLLARFGEVTVSKPGGCVIGQRPIDFHLRGMRALGARIEEEHGDIRCTAKRLLGAHIALDFPSVGATENLLMAAALADGTTVIENAAREPEVVDLANFLREAGVRIEGSGQDR